MRPYRKPFEAGSVFPFDFVHRDRKDYKTELPDHLHDWHEIVYIYDGNGTFFIDRALYEMKRGDLFLIPGNTIHQSFPDLVDPVTSTATFFSTAFVQTASFGDSFSYLRCFEHARKHNSFKLEVPAAERPLLEQTLDEIAREREERLPGYRQAVLLHVQRLLLLIGRSLVPPGEAEAAASAVIGPPWMKDILLHIDEHPEAALGLSDLAGQAAVTPAHFSRVFKQLTGMNVTEYVTAKRIVKAKELLHAGTDSSIGDIAERCGFESLPHFHRMFKKLTGMTPASYKKSAPAL